VKLVAALAAAAAAMLASVPTASAHVAIRLDLRAPRSGEHTGPDTDVVVFAQPMLAGRPEASFAMALDGAPVDALTGRPSSQSRPGMVTAGRTTTVRLHGLTSGPHRVTIEYRPDVDEPLSTASTSFPVTARERAPLMAMAAAVAVAAALVAAGALDGRRKHRARPPRRPA
jgi:hypothetical protein